MSRGPQLGVAPAPGGIDLEEGELGESAIGHRSHASARLLAVARCSAARPPRTPPAASRRRRVLIVAAADRDRRRASSRAMPGFSPGLMSAGLGTVPAGADLPRHHPGQPGLRLALRRGAAAARCSVGDRVPRTGTRSSSAPTPPRPTSSRACSRRRSSDAGIPVAGRPARWSAGADRRRPRTASSIAAASTASRAPCCPRRDDRPARSRELPALAGELARRRPADRDRAPAAGEQRAAARSGSPGAASTAT